ncbi:MAG: hypothetical protein LC672_07075, partial [Acidobacteria bacterium]|nr:hypothetical protein [Acidobacteriota bacterium]
MTLAVMVRRLVADLPANNQSSFVSLAPTTITNLNGRGAIPLAASTGRLLSNTKTINHVSSGLCPCYP